MEKRFLAKRLVIFFYDNGKKAFSKTTGDVFYNNGKRAYSSTTDRGFFESRNSMGTADGVHHSAEGVSMDLGPNVDSFECNLGEGLTVHIQVGHKPSFKRAQLHDAYGGVIFEV